MRILQVVQQPCRRGAEVFAAQLSHELERAGHDCRTTYLYSYAGYDALPLGPGDECLGADPADPWERRGIRPAVLRRLGTTVARFRPDVVQLNGGRTVKYGALLRRLVRRSPWLAVYRNIGNPSDWITGAARTAFYRWAVFPGLDGIVALSPASRDTLQGVFGVRVPVETIPTGILPEALQALTERTLLRRRTGTAEEAPVVLYVGRLSAEKRVDRLLRSFKIVRERFDEANLWLVGEGPNRSELESLAVRLGIANAVRFLGATSEVGSFYSAANVLVLTSDTEGVPAVVLEASYAGLPVVATNVGSLSECVRDGETGILVPPTDADVAHGLCRVLGSRDLGHSMGRAGRRWVTGNFAMEHIALRYVCFFERLTAGSSGRIPSTFPTPAAPTENP